MSYWRDKKVLVTGAHGFVGHAVLKELESNDCGSVIAPTKEECDLRKEDDVKQLFEEKRPDIVIHCAGKVGGIAANRSALGEFFYDNLMMGTLVLEYSRQFGVKKLVGLAVGCGYPKYLEPPFKEIDYWKDLPDENSIGYSMAKKMLVIQSWTYREQYGFDSSILLPANLYGPHDNFHLESSHVVPALIRKFVEAVINKERTVEVWGTGAATREFLYVNDTARALLKVAENYDESGPLNLGTGVESSIKELVELIKKISGFSGEIEWNKSRPDGQPRRYYDMSLFKEKLKYVPSTSLEDGLRKTIDWYRLHREHIQNNH